jgi:hypothetical protein
MKRMSLDAWQRSTSVAINTKEVGLVTVSRAAIVKYMANRKGGVHFDPTRALQVHGKRKRREVESHLLDHGLLRVGHLSGPEFEVASMVRAIVASDWACELIRAARNVAEEHLHGDPTELKLWTGQKEADGSGWATMTFGPSADPG